MSLLSGGHFPIFVSETEGYAQDKGKAYVQQNPELRNPIPLDRIIAVATLAVATIALFVGCVRLIATL